MKDNITVILLDNNKDIFSVDFNEPAAALLMTICNKYKYSLEDVVFTVQNDDKESKCLILIYINIYT